MKRFDLVVCGLLLVSGYEYWQRYSRDRQEQAESQYRSYTEALEKKDESAAMAPGKFRVLLKQMLGVPNPAPPVVTVR